jgi:stearoyl-CoA desaturase (delta-9 desaturase)
LAYTAAGWWGVLAWWSGVFLFTFVVRDFNFRGHSSLMGNEKHGEPVNQFVFGLFAGEWHENHHSYPKLARSGLAWWQVDIPYWIIIAMKWSGIVSEYNSLTPATVYRPDDAEVVV